MSRLTAALKLEITLQRRYKFLHAAVFSGVLWLALLLPMPSDLRSTAEPYVILGDLMIVGFFFVAAAVFFEKGERTLHALVATPLRFREYLASKVVTLTTLSVVLAVFVATTTHGVHYDLPLLVLGATLGTILMLLLGFLTALPFTSVSDWFMPSVLPIALFNLPIFHYSGLSDAAWFFLIPTQGPLMVLGAAFDQKTLTAWQFAYSVGYPVLFAAGMWLLAHRMFDKYLVAKTGGA
ncbi:fluoroquinolone transporter permease [Kibdelosporangium persicum]|uniref:Antibiotic-transport integral membrane leucine and valine rich protein ABC transporter n=1 Tax=Kibdelosporangium persicum TaxID=2698649 RepID=A0ABX2FIJ5_9PSEU|nr:fluoroquinolone transporter permease [Kibdelosporangium persicum]NRN70640.1 Antibiotic-transport integral membrane leucine and valine rich protein ABC transporter [Kibdelosporangium persicum]